MARTTMAPPRTASILRTSVAAGYVPVDARPLAAFHGWRLAGEERGGHVPGAIALPAAWVRAATARRARETADPVADRPDLVGASRLVVYGGGADDADVVATALRARGRAEVLVDADSWSDWSADPDLPVERLPNHRALVHPAWLRALLDGTAPEHPPTGRWLLVHAGHDAARSYEASHVPGAVYLDTSALEAGRDGDVRPPAELEAALAAIGIDRDTTVVLYGRDTPMPPGETEPGRHAGRIAAMRAAFILMVAGVRDVRVLDGGYDAWVGAGEPVEAGTVPPSPLPGTGLDIPERPELIVERDEVERMLADRDGAAVVSVRSHAEQSGRTSGYERLAVAGRIEDDRWVDCGSDAYHMEAYRGPDEGMRPSPEIAARWAEAGITPDKRVAFYCGTGWRASEAWFAAHLMGWPRIGIYDGGWFEWSASTPSDRRGRRTTAAREPADHWDRVYGRTAPEATGWYEADPRTSLELIERCDLGPDDPIADIGCGASFLIDRLLDAGHRDLVALDVSPIALEQLRDRLADRADRVRFVTHDLAAGGAIGELVDLACWHDRAALHFLVEDDDRDAYARTLRASVRPGGWVILATFSLDGARTCSGLPVRNHDAGMLAELLGDGFEPVDSLDRVYRNPRGEPRPYVYARFRRR